MGSKQLFQADVILSAPKIVLQPQSNEIYWLIMQCIRDCVESSKVGSSLNLKTIICNTLTSIMQLNSGKCFSAICALDAWDLHQVPSTTCGG